MLFLLGITGYSLIEDWNLLDSLYMTVITLSTFVILEKELENPKQLKNYQYIAGDATEDENLIKAGIQKAG